MAKSQFDEIKRLIGGRIKEIRAKTGMTQEELAEKCDINSKYLSNIERGKENPTLNTIIKLSQSLGVEPYDLFTCLDSQDPAKAKALIKLLLKKASTAQQKTISKILSAIIH